MLKKVTRWIYLIFGIFISLGVSGMDYGVIPLNQSRPSQLSAEDFNHALLLIAGATLIVLIIFGTAFFRRKNK